MTNPGSTAAALLLLARTDPAAGGELLASLELAELQQVASWLVKGLTDRCGWSDRTLSEWVLAQEAAA